MCVRKSAKFEFNAFKSAGNVLFTFLCETEMMSNKTKLVFLRIFFILFSIYRWT